jgi:hypothetical protein
MQFSPSTDQVYTEVNNGKEVLILILFTCYYMTSDLSRVDIGGKIIHLAQKVDLSLINLKCTS